MERPGAGLPSIRLTGLTRRKRRLADFGGVEGETVGKPLRSTSITWHRLWKTEKPSNPSDWKGGGGVPTGTAGAADSAR